MGIDIIGMGLIYVLSFFLFFCINGRELELARTGVQMLERRSTAELKGEKFHFFNVRSFGAHADGHTDDRNAFLKAWNKACGSTGKVELLIPKGTYLIGPIRFAGPCRNVSSITVLMKGYLKATKDLSKYEPSSGWIEFRWMEDLNLTGGGTFDGQGFEAWPHNKCHVSAHCKLLPTNLKFIGTNRTAVQNITSLNSKFFHIALVNCKDFKGSQMNISAPGNSPNTDGIHVDRSSNVYISRSFIGSGDDCISVGQGNSRITIAGIICGPGHGISVGSLGRYPNEKDVNGLLVKDSIMIGTTNGVRIKTWADSPNSSEATNMTFENIIMINVKNPIIIDQTYCPFISCSLKTPSRVKLSNIYFKNIRGTSSSAVAVKLKCSQRNPCQNIYFHDVHLDLSSGNQHATSFCTNVRVKYSGTQIPPPCD